MGVAGRALVLLVAVLFGAIGCSPAGPTDPPEGASPGPTGTAAGVAGTLVCDGTDVAFPAERLAGPASAELGPGPAAEALRSMLADPDNLAIGFPPSGWWVVAESASSVTFVASGRDGWVVATMAPGEDGAWEFFEGGQCSLAIRLPEELGFASWRPDPANPPDPAATTIAVLATELACASGRPPVGRLLAPIVTETPDSVTIAIVVRDAPGAQECPGNPEVPIVVDLASPLGDRGLFDGSEVPPAPR